MEMSLVCPSSVLRRVPRSDQSGARKGVAINEPVVWLVNVPQKYTPHPLCPSVTMVIEYAALIPLHQSHTEVSDTRIKLTVENLDVHIPDVTQDGSVQDLTAVSAECSFRPESVVLPCPALPCTSKEAVSEMSDLYKPPSDIWYEISTVSPHFREVLSVVYFILPSNTCLSVLCQTVTMLV